MQSEYPLNSRVRVQIKRRIASGLLGEIPDGPRAIVRTREIAWDDTAPPEAYVGRTLDAVVIGHNRSYDQIELSLRCAERDPWDQVAAKYRAPSLVRGQVVGLIREGAFVELEPGVEGFLPHGELPLDPKAQIEDWLWLGDNVRAQVLNIDPARRRLTLSIRASLAQRARDYRQETWARGRATKSAVTVAEVLPQNLQLRLLRIRTAKIQRSTGPQLEVLLVEDDDTFASGISSFLEYNQCQVTRLSDGEEALAEVRARNRPFDLIILDWNLPDLKGDELVDLLQGDGCSSQLVLVMEPEPLYQRPTVWSRLWESGVDVCSKLDGAECRTYLLSVLAALRQGAAGAATARTREFPRAALQVPSLVQEAAPEATEDETGLPEKDYPRALPPVLMQLMRDTGASTVMLLRLDPGRLRPEVEAAAGEWYPIEIAPPDLIHSPLKEILEHGKTIHEKVHSDSARFDRLLEIGRFEGFLGLPVPTGQTTRYALLLLKGQGSFGRRHRLIAQQSAYLMAGLLQEQRLMRILKPWQSQQMAGQLLNSAIHELTNKLGGMDHLIDTVLMRLDDLVRSPQRIQNAGFLRSLNRDLHDIADAHAEAMELRDQYLGLTASDQRQEVQLPQVAEGVVAMLHPEAQRHNILLEVRAVEGLPPVHAQPSQIRQVFLNLMLNAIQQMAAYRLDGRLAIELAHKPGAELPIQVRVVDEGPGIHTYLWDHVFEFGFTTRDDGAGLGLTISRQIASSLEGRLQVETSDLFWGTIFLLELPTGAQYG